MVGISLVIFFVQIIHAQAVDETPRRLTTTGTNSQQFPHVSTYVDAFDAGGLPIEGLTEQAFTLKEAVTTTSDFGVTRDSAQPLHLVLVLDASTWDANNWRVIRNAMHSLVDSLRPDDKFAMYVYTSTVGPPLYGFDTPKEKAKKLLDQVPDPVAYSAFNAAFLAGIKTATEVKQGRRAVIMVADRLDNLAVKSANTYNPLSTLPTSLVPVYILGYGEQALRQRSPMEQLAKATGGKAFVLASVNDIEQQVHTLALLLRQGYRINYTSAYQVDDKTHPLSITLKTAEATLTTTTQITATRRPITITVLSPISGTVVSGGVPLDVQISSPAVLERVDVAIDQGLAITTVYGPINGNLVWDSTTATPGMHTVQILARDKVGNEGNAKVALNVEPPLTIQALNFQICPQQTAQVRPPCRENDWSTPVDAGSGMTFTTIITTAANSAYVPAAVELQLKPITPSVVSTLHRNFDRVQPDKASKPDVYTYTTFFTYTQQFIQPGQYGVIVLAHAPGFFQNTNYPISRTFPLIEFHLFPSPPTCFEDPLRHCPQWTYYSVGVLLTLLLLLLLVALLRMLLQWWRRGWYTSYLITLTNQSNIATPFEIQVESKAPRLRFTFAMHGKQLLPPASALATPSPQPIRAVRSGRESAANASISAAPTMQPYRHATNGHTAGSPEQSTPKKAEATTMPNRAALSRGVQAFDKTTSTLSESAQLLSLLTRYVPAFIGAPLGKLASGLRTWTFSAVRGKQDVQQAQRQVKKLTPKSPMDSTIAMLDQRAKASKPSALPSTQLGGSATPALLELQGKPTSSKETQTTRPADLSAVANPYSLVGAPNAPSQGQAIISGWAVTPEFQPGDRDKIYLRISTARSLKPKKLEIVIRSRPTAKQCESPTAKQEQVISILPSDWQRQKL
ncbi:MAG: hypothetical protein U0350_43565 [Caldilineaceae bacterium]